MTDTSEAPIAYRMSTPKPRTRSGTITTPPPSPVSAPKKPAATDPRQSSSVNSSTVINSPPGLGRRHTPTHTVQAEHPLTGSLWFLGVGVGYLPLEGEVGTACCSGWGWAWGSSPRAPPTRRSAALRGDLPLKGGGKKSQRP